MTTYFGNTGQQIDWDNIITNIDNMNFDFGWCPRNITEWRNKAENQYKEPYKTEMQELLASMEDAGLDFAFVQIGEYWLKKEDPLLKQFGSIVGATPILAYISVIGPGNGITPHWDIDDNEHQQNSMGRVRRFSCFIEKPAMGHVFIVGDKHLYNQEQGSIWEWDSYKTDHIGANFGLTNKYLFNFLGYSS